MKISRAFVGRLLVAMSIAGAAAATTSCGPLSNNESAVLLVIRAGGDFLNMVTAQTEAFRVSVSDGGNVVLDEVYDNTGGWPTDPTSHSLLLIAAVTDGNTRTVRVDVFACDNNQCNATILGTADTTITFRAGEQLNDVTVTINP